MNVLITGATGFVGLHLCHQLFSRGHNLRILARDEHATLPGCEVVVLPDFTRIQESPEIFGDIDAVVHLAARTHQADLQSGDAWLAYEADNVTVTRALAECAFACGVRRFLYMSSIKVNGEDTGSAENTGYSPDQIPRPLDNYGRSKLMAEQVLGEIFEPPTASLTIFRTPLVFGPGQKGNIHRLMCAIDAHRWLPLGGLHNRRSLIYVENLVDAIARALEARQSHAQVYTLADCDLSTTQLIRAMAVALGHPARVSDVPASVLNFFGTVFGKRETTRRLTGSLVVDRSAFVRDFDWVPPVSLEVAMARTAGWMRAQDATE